MPDTDKPPPQPQPRARWHSARSASLLLQTAAFYNLVSLGARMLFTMSPGPTDAFMDSVMDSAAAADALLALYTVFIEKGKPRAMAVIRHRLPDVGLRVLLHMLALASPVQVRAMLAGAVAFFPTSVHPRLLRLLLLPQALSTAKWLPETTLQQAVVASASLGGLAALQVTCAAVPIAYTQGHLTPFAVLATACCLRLLAALLWGASGNGAQRKSAIDEQVLKSNNLDEICECMVRVNPLLKDAQEGHPEFVGDILSRLKHERFPPGSTLANIGEVGHHMFFLAKGTVKGTTSNNLNFYLHAGTSFGEVALMNMASKRTATLTAETSCEVFLLNQHAFDRLRSSYPALALSVRKMVSRYLTADSAHYVRICMREALHCCYVIALSIFVMIYITLSFFRS